MFVYSTDYLRLKNLEIGYTIPAHLLKKAGISRLRIFANTQNLLTFDTIKVIDPENDNKDFTAYPQRRYFRGGISITF